MATSSTWWAWQKAAKAAIPSAVLANEPPAPSRPMQTSKEDEEISTPQIMRVTVTFLVCATGSHATVRSCVTWAAVPGLSVGDKTPQDEREPSARGGPLINGPPLRHLHSSMPLLQRYKDDRICGWEGGKANAGPSTPLKCASLRMTGHLM